MAPTQPAIDVRNLTKVFGRFTAVDRVSFTVMPGEIFGFLGPNGAGKSTTIRMLCGLLASTAGTATVGGFDINRDPDRVRQGIGYMSQRFSLYRDLTVTENLAFFGGVYGLAGAGLKSRASDVLRMTGLDGTESAVTGTLSGAIQQRLALACAILHDPSILFLDEPTSGVDPVSRRRFWELIQDLAAQGTTIFITTHFLDEAEFCGRIGLIGAGHLVALDSPAAVRHSVPEDVFELTVDDLTVAGDLLRNAPAILGTACFGPRLHVYCPKARFSADTLAAHLATSGVPVRSVRPVPMTLEDAFMRLVTPAPPHGTAPGAAA